MPKNEATKAYLGRINKTFEASNIAIYSDALNTSSGKSIGIGLIAYNSILGDSYIATQKSQNMSLLQTVYNGELEGIAKATEYARNLA